MNRPKSNPVYSAIEIAARAARVRKLRGIRGFAEGEVVLPSGPYKDERFKVDRLPWFGLWFAAIDSGQWRRFCLTGVGQGGKTLAGSALPVMYHLFEHRETVVYAAPVIEMANDKWRQDILPLIEASAYRDMLPEGGKGSKGGNVLSLQFRHGPTLRFMSARGSDKSKAGFTSRVVVITESDAFDEAAETSREADPFNQIEARSAAFADRAVCYQECTVSTEEGRTWRELKAGTDSAVILPCPHCDKWGSPEREQLRGWQEAKDVLEARAVTHLYCPRCGVAWSEDDRAAANARGVLLHRGQDLADDGRAVVGAAAPALTFAMRFTAANNLLVPMARVAEEEFNAPRTTDPGLAERKLRQFYWTLPLEPDAITLSEIDAAAIAARTVPCARGRVPADATKITVGIDPGKWNSHWVALAWRGAGATPHVFDYGVLDVPSASMAVEHALLTALRRFRDEIAAVGWPVVGEGEQQLMRPALTLVDSGDWESTVVAFALESGSAYFPAKGFGIKQIAPGGKLSKEPGYLVVPQAAGHQLCEINADFWKSWLHARIQTPIVRDAVTGAVSVQPGGFSLFAGTLMEHLTFAKHLTAEKREEEFVAGKGLVTKWVRLNRNNHYLDATCLACVAGHGAAGQRVVVPQLPAVKAEAPPPRKARPAWMPALPRGYAR